MKPVLHNDRRMLSVRPLLGLLLCLWIFPNLAVAEEIATASDRLLHDLKYLASDEMQGRGVGTEGLDRAADYIKAEFAKAGLDVTTVKGDAFQIFPITTGSEEGDKNRLVFKHISGKELKPDPATEARVQSFGGAGKFDAPLAFVGYGIDHKEYNDFDGVDVKGKVAIILRRNPQQTAKEGPFASVHGGVSRHAALTTKLSNAYRKGAVAVLFVNDPYNSTAAHEKLKKQIAAAKKTIAALKKKSAESEGAQKQKSPDKKKLADQQKLLKTLQQRLKNYDADPLMKFGYGGNGKPNALPVFHITQKTANALIEPAMGKTLSQIETEIDKDLKPQSAVLDGWTATGMADVKRIESQIKNVIGVVEGKGPHADETIVIGAHYDHVGMGGAGSLAPGVKEVHNGADDNASGTAALLELARRLGSRKEPLPRRIVFMAFTAEEIGLIGSAHYVKNPIFPLKNTIAMLNMDMVGRMRENELTVFGTGTAKVWEPLLKEHNEAGEMKLIFKPEGFGPSDHSSFYGKKIPVLHMFTNTHRDYHRPTDDWDKINVKGMAKVVDLMEGLTVATANNPERPAYVEIKARANIQRGGSRPYFGSIPDFGTNEVGYAISGVAPGSPAAKGGLKGGDVIVKLGDQKIGSLDDFDLALRKYEAGEQVAIVVKRAGKEVPLKVILDQPR